MSNTEKTVWLLGAFLGLMSVLVFIPVEPGTSPGGWIIQYFTSASFYWFVMWVVVWVWSAFKK